MEYLLGLDIGSSSVKGALVNAGDGSYITSASSPDTELPINAPMAGWAEQHPDIWWTHVCNVLNKLSQEIGSLSSVKAIGISYQMHGLVIVDEKGEVLRPSIIWCDSRAGEIGNIAGSAIGDQYHQTHLLNHPGNFTASKLGWVKSNEPDIFNKTYKFMLPGDYIAMKFTGSIATTQTGLSEGIFWDFEENQVSQKVMDHFGFSKELIPELVPVFGIQGEVSKETSTLTGLPSGIPVSYRAGDQPNNALSLNVFKPGELAATAGTSGVIYGILDKINHDPLSRVNVFSHVNDSPENTRLGVLLCINGTGISFAWLKRMIGLDSYPIMNKMAIESAPGADGLMFFPFGNGAERIHQNKTFGGQMLNIDFNRHESKHLIRSVKEGIAYALNYGFEAMREMGVRTETVRAGHANLFLSPLFAEIFSSVTDTVVELYDTDGSVGAARGAGIGIGDFSSTEEAFQCLHKIKIIEPDTELKAQYYDLYSTWKSEMIKRLS